MNTVVLRVAALLAVSVAMGNGLFAQGQNSANPEPATASAAKEEPAIPQSIDGWELHVLDVSKPVIFQLPDGRRQKVEVPIFVYLPSKNEGSSLSDSLKEAVATVKELMARGEPVSPQELRLILVSMEAAAREARRSEQARPPFRK